MTKKIFLFLFLLTGLNFLSSAQEKTMFNITNFRAINDGATLCTYAINQGRGTVQNRNPGLNFWAATATEGREIFFLSPANRSVLKASKCGMQVIQQRRVAGKSLHER